MIVQASNASTAARTEALVKARRFAEAFELLSGPEGANDPQALFTLATWRLSGRIIRRDLAAARVLFEKAAELGHTEAAHIYISFVANGTGGTADWESGLGLLRKRATKDRWANQQLDIIGKMNLEQSGESANLATEERLSERPFVSCFRHLFTAEECSFLVREAQPFLAPSLVIDPSSGLQQRNPVRTSDSMAFPFVRESPAVHALNRRIAAITGSSVREGEPLQILRYRPRQQYRPHFDAESGTDNQRILTVLVYLNEDYEGGETRFVRTGLTFKGKRGDALVFRNALPDGRPDELTQHAGLPVTAGEKLIASRWIRQREFLLDPPAPLLPV